MSSRRVAFLSCFLGAAVSSGCTDNTGASEATGSSEGGSMTGSSGTTAEADGSSTSAASTGSTGDVASTSTTASSSSGVDSAGEGGSSESGAAMGDSIIVAVGYGGMRVRSLDDGQTWSDYTALAAAGGDDENLLRGAAFGAGRFVAVGFRIFSSPDGAQWTEHENPTSQWYGAVQYGNGQFLAVGGGGYCARSSDGIDWETCTDVTDDNEFTHVRSTLFLDGEFYTADANGVLRSSPEGDVWTVVDANFGSPWAAVVDGEIVPLEENAPAELPGVRLRGSGGQIERAEPGSDEFTAVYDIPDGNSVFQANRFAFAEGEVE